MTQTRTRAFALAAVAAGGVLAASLLGAPATAASIPAGSKDTPLRALECPKEAPAGTMRGKAKGKDIHALCTRAAANAPTRAAKHAVIYAFNQLGKPYLCNGSPNQFEERLKEDSFDSSSLIYHAYRYAGINTGGIGSTRNIIPWDGVPQAEWVRTLKKGAKAKPGDINGYLTTPKEPAYGHVTLQVGKNLIIHTNSCGDGVHITSKQPGKPYYVGTYRVVPRIARTAN